MGIFRPPVLVPLLPLEPNISENHPKTSAIQNISIISILLKDKYPVKNTRTPILQPALSEILLVMNLLQSQSLAKERAMQSLFFS
jgi:hypothetical protein